MCIAQGRLNSAVPPCLTRRMSGPPCPLCAPYREAHGFPTGASPPLAARPLRSLLGSERLALATAGRLSAHDLPSLAGDAAGKTLSVNALGYRIPHCASVSPRSVLFALGTRRVAVQTGRAPKGGAACEIKDMVWERNSIRRPRPPWQKPPRASRPTRPSRSSASSRASCGPASTYSRLPSLTARPLLPPTVPPPVPTPWAPLPASTTSS